MTNVCPKCMHTSADEQSVCERCGTPLLSTAPGGDAVHPTADLAPGRPTSSPRSTTATGHKSAITDVIEYLESTAHPKPKAQLPSEEQDAKPERRINRSSKITIAVVVVAVIAIGLFFGLDGTSSGTPTTNTGTPTAAKTPALLFQFAGSGSSTTGTFSSTAPFTFTYKLTCQNVITTPYKFELLRNAANIGLVDSKIGAKVENGTQKNFGKSGTSAIAVDTPSTCKWVISGST
jgi:hypothetical protein